MAVKTELAPLTGLRFAAAFAILFQHTMQWCVPFNNSRVTGIAAATIGVYGMPLFFVLSGFVIHYNYGQLFRKQSYTAALRDFFGARFARLYPLFIFFALFGIVSDFTTNWIGYAPRAWLSYVVHEVTLTQSWVYKIVVNHRVLLDNGFGLGWSVSTEFFFYIAYAVFVFAVLPLRRPSLNLLVLVLFSAAVFCGLSLAYVHSDALMAFARPHVTVYIDAHDDFSNSLYRWFFYYSPYTRIWEFVLGCLTAQLFLLVQDRKVSESEHTWGILLLGMAIFYLVAFAVLHAVQAPGSRFIALVQFFSLNFGCAVPIAIVIFCCARYRNPVGAFFSLPWAVWLGEISFSIYAVHTWTLRPFIRPSEALNVVYAADAILRVTFAIAFTLIVATATYAIIEVPCRRYLRAKLMRREAERRPTDTATTPADAPPADAPVAAQMEKV